MTDSRRRLLFRPIAAAVLAACGWLAGHAQQAPAGPGQPLTVMSFNIRYGTANDGDNHWTRRREMLFDVVREQNADLIGVQEALAAQIDEMIAAAPAYAVVGVGRDDGRARGEFSAILFRRDRFRVADSGTFWFSDTPAVPGSKSWGNSHHTNRDLGALDRSRRLGLLSFQLASRSSVAAVARTQHGAAAAADRRARGAGRTGRRHWRLQRWRGQPRARDAARHAGRAPGRRSWTRSASSTPTQKKSARSTASSSARRPGGQDRLRARAAWDRSHRRGDRADESRRIAIRPITFPSSRRSA